MANQYPIEDFQKIYDAIYASMGDDETLKANIEAALKPMYEQSKQQLEAERVARNAGIDVDAYSRGMGNSTWVTDAKLRQLKNEQQNLAELNANYNSQLYNALLNAQQNRDNNAYSQALQMYQLQQQGGHGGGGSGKANNGFWADGKYWDSEADWANWKSSQNTVDDSYTTPARNRNVVNGVASISKLTDENGNPMVYTGGPVGGRGQYFESRGMTDRVR